MDTEMKTAYDSRHKQAFRIAFDALNEVFPPENTAEYWEKANGRLRDTYNAHMDNPLAKRLLVAVQNYLGDAVKEEALAKEG